ncbi:hypothetical protein ACFX2I_022243 [Malus domestica]|uniref:Electron transfer flavoprotein alpha/beta-subunit N-terminal domain-containing protein n=1 Tax=Malus domestica TaxID=3750 RepID=A0A498HNN4_MALDO|nr:hypothetical protein DVH24_013517 [Malus domestica]
MSASLTPIYGEAAPKSRTRDLPLMGEGTCHRTKCDLFMCTIVVLDKEKQVVTVDQEVDGGLETLCLDFPAVITTDLRLNDLRYATLPSIMKEKSKVITKYTPQDLNVEIKSDLEQVQVAEPPTRKAGVLFSSVDELIDKLKNEAHVI